MVVCLIALVVFGFLAIFSATYRPAAKEALHCVFRRVTLRKCETGFDKRLKAKIAGKLMVRHPRLARFVFKRFELLSWFFTVLLILSLAYSGYSIYNLAVHGTCDPQNPEGCVFNIPAVEPSCVNVTNLANTTDLTNSSATSHCVANCSCEEVGCEPPDFTACGGNCTCIKEICGK